MLIAKTIAKYEPVSMLVQSRDLVTAQSLLAALPATPHAVDLVVSPLDDLWMRDTSCIFVVDKNNPTKKAEPPISPFLFIDFPIDPHIMPPKVLFSFC
ncbi:agmatine deiminase family protein [Deltaproteobacteria bacterium TL4]